MDENEFKKTSRNIWVKYEIKECASILPIISVDILYQMGCLSESTAFALLLAAPFAAIPFLYSAEKEAKKFDKIYEKYYNKKLSYWEKLRWKFTGRIWF